MKSILRIHRLLLLVLSAFCCGHARAADRRPNFLFIYTDDHRWDAMGVVQREQGGRARFPWLATPGMDRLAAGGVRFRNAFVTLSLCAPSRAAFLTGRYNHANGITNNSTPFPADAVTHATLLRTSGYRTAYIGKWHMGNQRGQRPGFDYSASFVGQGGYQNHPFEINGAATPTTGWVDDVSTGFAIEWMKQNKDRPFSMVVGLKSPHGPRGGNNLPERLRGLYAGETSRPVPNCGVPAIFHPSAANGKAPGGLAGNDVHLDYLRHIHGVDENIGRMLDALDALGLAEDTVVVYSSDNGYFLGEHNSGDKRALYEESLRIPFLVRYPRLFGKGTVVDEMVLNLDLAPTFLDLAGVPVPPEMQGASWKELAAGRKPADWRQSFLAHYYKELGEVPTCYAIRTTTHKLVKYPNLPEFTEVFDLTADPYEIKNLAPDTALTAKLEAELEGFMKKVDYTPPPNANKARQPASAKPAAGPDPGPDPGIVARLRELDAYWAVVSRAVKEGDFEAYRATCHEEGVLVSGGKQTSQPLAHALERWKPEFTDTKAGKRQSDVTFRFSRRVGDATTAHETGIFRYTFQLPGQPPKVEYVHFEGLLVKKADGWKILMENQQGPATEALWDALK